MNSIVAAERRELANTKETNLKQFVSMKVAGQLFGIPVLTVQDILRTQRITKTPLAPPEILGSINLRGRIVTVIGMRTRLSLPSSDSEKVMHVVVEYKDQQYSLVVDSVGEVLNLPLSQFEPTPPNLSQSWKSVALGVYRLDDEIMVVLDIESLLNIHG